MSDIETITTILFEPGDNVEVRCIKGKVPDVKIQKRWTLAKDLPSMSDELHELNRQGYNIYYGVNPRKSMNKSGDNNVLLARCLFADFDNVAAGDGLGIFEFVHTDIFLAGLPEETLAVYSGHGLHVYWRLEEPIHDLNVWRSLQIRLNAKLKADPAIKNFERFMRLPGYKNTKKEPYQDCFIVWSPIHANRQD